MSLRPALAFVLAAACAGEDPEKQTTPDPNDVEALAACDESDFESPPFLMGPSFDPETGVLVEPLPDSYLVATTVGWAKPEAEHGELLSDYSNRIIDEQLFQQPGLLGATFGSSAVCGSARTLTVWRDEEALLTFVTSGVHAEAMSVGMTAVRGWETTHWTESSAEPPTWDDARTQLADLR